MSDAATIPVLQKYRITLGWLLLAMWLVYLTTLFPILDEYLPLSLFTLAVSIIGLLGAALALRGHRLWINVSCIAAALLVIRYMIYWYDIRGTILIGSPDMSMFAVLGEIANSGMRIFEHRLSQGEVLGATLTMINEFVMPLLQIGILVITGVLLIVDGRHRHRQAKH